MERLLTIAIPVYNGMPFLRECLSRVVSQIPRGGGEDSIEILISDNASTDRSAEVIEYYRATYPDLIRVHQQPQNLGYDLNVMWLVEAARGEFVWFLGCQDLAYGDSVQRLLSVLRSSTADYLKLAFTVAHENQPLPEEHPSAEPHRQFYGNAEEFLEAQNGPGLALSTNVVRATSWKLSRQQLLLDGWIHVQGIFDIICSRAFQGAEYIPAPMFHLFREVGGWWETPAVYSNFLKHLEYLSTLPTRTRGQKKWQRRRLSDLRGDPLRHSVALGKQRGFVFNGQEIRRLARAVGPNPIQLFDAVALAVSPQRDFRTDEDIDRKLRRGLPRRAIRKLLRVLATELLGLRARA